MRDSRKCKLWFRGRGETWQPCFAIAAGDGQLESRSNAINLTSKGFGVKEIFVSQRRIEQCGVLSQVLDF